ncbi:MAG: glycosyltransferase family 2 protein [Planctomycetota bacterium]|jgi:dolichol-phosphate mannosyltransferase|nr:glycosyltransferase family 2 protein [Planctomycetota bacterium]
MTQQTACSTSPQFSTSPDHPHGVAVSVVVPSFNEANTIRALILAVQMVLRDQPNYEIIVVDDNSPDGTWRLVEAMALDDARIRCHRRVDRKGLASAIVDGLSQADGQCLVVMDADLQHDPNVIPQLVASLDEHPVVVASRYVSGGSVAGWNRTRRWGSMAMSWLSRRILGLQVSDPLSGYFAMRRELFHEVAGQLRPRGYKALLEILYRAKCEAVGEVPLVFKLRQAGVSKLGWNTVCDLLVSLLELRSGRVISQRFIQYGLIGASGVLVQIGLYLLFRGQLGIELALALAILCAMVSNYLLNNWWTFGDRSMAGAALGWGFVRFAAVSTVGAVINHSLTIRSHDVMGIDVVLTSFIGIAVATVWNYQLNSGLTWRMWERSE